MRQLAKTAAHELFRNVFRSTKIAERPLAPQLTDKALLYPVYGSFDNDQLAAVASAASAVGDSELIVSFIDVLDEHPDWVIPIDDLSGYDSLAPLANAVYSPRGTWGILISRESLAMVGGSKEFVEKLLSHYPETLESQLDAFLETVKTYRSAGEGIGWVKEVLSDIYGAEEAEFILVRAGLVAPKGDTG